MVVDIKIQTEEMVIEEDLTDQTEEVDNMVTQIAMMTAIDHLVTEKILINEGTTENQKTREIESHEIEIEIEIEIKITIEINLLPLLPLHLQRKMKIDILLIKGQVREEIIIEMMQQRIQIIQPQTLVIQMMIEIRVINDKETQNQMTKIENEEGDKILVASILYHRLPLIPLSLLLIMK